MNLVAYNKNYILHYNKKLRILYLPNFYWSVYVNVFCSQTDYSWYIIFLVNSFQLLTFIHKILHVNTSRSLSIKIMRMYLHQNTQIGIFFRNICNVEKAAHKNSGNMPQESTYFVPNTLITWMYLKVLLNWSLYKTQNSQ